MKLLALDTASRACSVAIATPDGVIERHLDAGQHHTDVVIAALEEVLATAGLSCASLDAIAFGQGPGTFSGVRTAAAIAQGLALAHDLPLVPVSSLAALAAGGARLHRATAVVAALDARRSQVYFGAYRFTAGALLATTVIADCLATPTEIVLATPGDWLAVGQGWSAYADVFAHNLPDLVRLEPLYPHAQDLARLARQHWDAGVRVSACEALPVYVREALE
jgi:tRNA threonylcarbamoyladenosine biosynthesis protein TsaB